MDGRLLLKGCSVFRADGRVRERVAVVVEGGRVARVAPETEVPTLPGDWEVACGGRLVAPGLVDCHSHLVGGQLQPLWGERLMRGTAACQEQQRKLASLLTVGEVEALTAFGLARALRSGVTMVAEHLLAPGCVREGLSAQARTAERLGARLVNSHASNSRDGEASGLAQVEENAAYAASVAGSALVRPAIGVLSSSACDDAVLEAAGRHCQELRLGAHFHLAEFEEDLSATYAKYACRVAPRLERFGLLGKGCVAAYAKAVDRSEAELLARSRTVVALSPRESLLVEPGPGSLEALLSHQTLVGLGTGGVGRLWDELSFAFAAALQMARLGRVLDPDGLMAQLLVGGPAELCSMLFGLPSGDISEGAMADLVVYDYVPPGGGEGTARPFLLMELGRHPVAWTVVAGRVVVREGQLLGTDEGELSREAAAAIDSVWARLP